jgi:hypothetical protein
VTTAEFNGLKQTHVDLRGTFLFSESMMGPPTEERPGYRMLAAVIETDSGPWFVKLIGPEKTVGYWKQSFYEFTGSIKASS